VGEKEIKSIVGKLIHIKPLVPAGKYCVDAIMATLALSDQQEHIVLSARAKSQFELWIGLLRTCSGSTTIPFPYDNPPAWAANAYTDAAGGSATNPASGTGGCMNGWWYWVPWSKQVQHGILKHEGKKVGRKLTALELIGPLVVLAANFDKCRYGQVTIWVDNSGAIGVWKKGYSNHCGLSSTIVKAISAIASAAGCDLFIKKITRCSTPGAKVADALSKGNFKQARDEAAASGVPLHTDPARVPVQLLRWIQEPVSDYSLGSRILSEIAGARPILGR
jgi:hypothetical protein